MSGSVSSDHPQFGQRTISVWWSRTRGKPEPRYVRSGRSSFESSRWPHRGHVGIHALYAWTPQQVASDLPDLDLQDIQQALAYAAALAKDELHPIRA